jgi:uncharacterized protein (TIGR02001 family)
MRKSVLSIAIAAAVIVPSLAAAETPAPPPLTGNVALVSDYRFRGISQTFGKPAFQGGFDYAHASGLYLGNWNSNVSSGAGYPGGNLEMDFYGGYKRAFGDFGADVGLLYYYYPGSQAGPLGAANPNSTKTNSGTVHNTELYLAGSWKWLTLKWSHAISDYFSVPDTKATNYFDLSGTYDIGSGWGVVGHVGRLQVHNFSAANYTDYKLGVTKDITGWVLGAALVSTNAKHNCGPTAATTDFYCLTKPNGGTYDAGKSTVVLSVAKTF